MRRWHGGCVYGAIVALLLSAPAHAQKLQWSGLEWEVKSGDGLGPGPNHWRRENVWVDKQGRLHLRIKNDKGVWTCGEVQSVKKFWFGEYRFEIVGRPDKFDPNIVLGLFHYPTADIGPDGTNEIDIEFSHWGDPAYPIGNYTVWPADAAIKQTSHTFSMALSGDFSTHSYRWQADSIVFGAFDGRGPDAKSLAAWTFRPTNPQAVIGQKPMPLLLNLWLMSGHAPTDGKNVEIIIAKVVTPKPRP